eukprot:GHVH01008756.1.p1 GENE.GHVH01008756.1~~GHVH01008756.1.p1  ORF type:complete len:113 (+),score=25.14 GHVH01008756.1:43-381(+)
MSSKKRSIITTDENVMSSEHLKKTKLNDDSLVVADSKELETKETPKGEYQTVDAVECGSASSSSSDEDLSEDPETIEQLKEVLKASPMGREIRYRLPFGARRSLHCLGKRKD